MTFVNRSTSLVRPHRSWTGLWLFLAMITLVASGLPAYAVNRDITITVPAQATAGSKVNVVIAARTDAGGGEQIGFFHADYSVDGGVTWTAIRYSTKSGQKASVSTIFTAPEANAKAIIRVRIAFRGGKSGDVDYVGKAIDWNGTWNAWQEPPAKFATVAIVAK